MKSKKIKKSTGIEIFNQCVSVTHRIDKNEQEYESQKISSTNFTYSAYVNDTHKSGMQIQIH